MSGEDKMRLEAKYDGSWGLQNDLDIAD